MRSIKIYTFAFLVCIMYLKTDHDRNWEKCLAKAQGSKRDSPIPAVPVLPVDARERTNLVSRQHKREGRLVLPPPSPTSIPLQLLLG